MELFYCINKQNSLETETLMRIFTPGRRRAFLKDQREFDEICCVVDDTKNLDLDPKWNGKPKNGLDILE